MSAVHWSRASTPVLALVCGLPSLARSARDLVMLRCFVDESGFGHGPVMVMAGLIADVESWARFSDDWQECLDMRPRLPFFHMAEMFADSWGDESKRRVARFQKIMATHAKGAVIVSIPLDDYRCIFGGQDVWKNPYLFLFFIFIRGYKRFSEEIGLDRTIDFVFDMQTGAMARVAEAWDFWKTEAPQLLQFTGGLPSFQDDKIVLPLQAADMLAWWIRRHMIDDLNGQTRLAVPWTAKDQIRCLNITHTADSLINEYAQMFEAPFGPVR
jgi:Protein of unknown function (DUF3800)